MLQTLRPLVTCLALSPAFGQNQALQLTTGIDGGVTCPFDARMVPPTGITVEAWVTYDDRTIPTGRHHAPTIARQGTTTNQESWTLRVDAGSTATRALTFRVRVSDGQAHAATYAFAPGEFRALTHIAGTFDGQQIRLYKDGRVVAVGTTSLLSEVQNHGGVLRIGNGDATLAGTETWNGVIDELRVWPMARSGAEIAATRHQALTGMAGGVLVFPFDGGWHATDGTAIGTPSGAVRFVPGVAPLTPVEPPLFVLGQPSSTCLRQPGMLVGSAPQLGNSAFALWCVRGPRPADSPASVLFAAACAAPIGQPSVLGLDVAGDLSTVVTSALQWPATDALGNARFPLPIPSQAALLGTAWVFQWAFVDSRCGAQGFTSSDGLLFAIQ